MNKNIKTVGQIASIFGIIFIVFAVIAAIVNYQGLTLSNPGSSLSLQVLQYYILNAMIPYLLYAALSFTVAGVIMRSTREPVEPEEAVVEEMKPAEVPPEQERDEPTP